MHHSVSAPRLTEPSDAGFPPAREVCSHSDQCLDGFVFLLKSRVEPPDPLSGQYVVGQAAGISASNPFHRQREPARSKLADFSVAARCADL